MTEFSHSGLLDRVRKRIKDKRVVALVKAFLKAGILTELGEKQDTPTGTPQGGILSPLMVNIALSVLDEHLHRPWRSGGTMSTRSQRERRRAKGLPNWRIVRYADDFAVLGDGNQADVEALREQISGVLATMGLAFSRPKPGWCTCPRGSTSSASTSSGTETRNKPLARLHLHRGPADPVVEGERCPDEQDVTAAPWIRADPARSDHARLVNSLPSRRQQTHLLDPCPLRVASGGPVADDAAPLEVDRPPDDCPPAPVAGGHPCRPTGKRCSTSKRSRSPDTATEGTSRPRGRCLPHNGRFRWRARCAERRTAGSASGLGRTEQSGHRAPDRLNSRSFSSR